jgi:NADPH:quinone reductase-like Zn-dependent oxidoreductase
MKAITYHRYGSPEVIGIEEVATPTPAEGQILVRVHASVVTPADGAARKGQPFLIRFMAGLRRPSQPILGSEIAGRVEAVGASVARFAVGDRVMAATGDTYGAHAEYVVLPEDGAVATMPDGATYEQAVALAEGPMTALPFLRDKGRIEPGMHVLINGASGSVGSAAVQLAKHLGAEVTAVSSTRNVELVTSLGADHVIDYTQADFTAARDRYDIIFDVVGKSSFGRSKGALRDGGIYLDTYPSMNTIWHQLVTSRFGSKKAVFAATGLRKAAEKQPDLVMFGQLFTAGELTPVIDRTYPMDRAAEAHAYVDTERKTGNVVLEMAGNSGA